MSAEVMQAYALGYEAGKKAAADSREKPYMTWEDLAERYDVGKSKALDILKAIRAFCNGGKLNHESRVLVAEVLYWESVVDKTKKERI